MVDDTWVHYAATNCRPEGNASVIGRPFAAASVDDCKSHCEQTPGCTAVTTHRRTAALDCWLRMNVRDEFDAFAYNMRLRCKSGIGTPYYNTEVMKQKATQTPTTEALRPSEVAIACVTGDSIVLSRAAVAWNTWLASAHKLGFQVAVFAQHARSAPFPVIGAGGGEASTPPTRTSRKHQPGTVSTELARLRVTRGALDNIFGIFGERMLLRLLSLSHLALRAAAADRRTSHAAPMRFPALSDSDSLMPQHTPLLVFRTPRSLLVDSRHVKPLSRSSMVLEDRRRHVRQRAWPLGSDSSAAPASPDALVGGRLRHLLRWLGTVRRAPLRACKVHMAGAWRTYASECSARLARKWQWL